MEIISGEEFSLYFNELVNGSNKIDYIFSLKYEQIFSFNIKSNFYTDKWMHNTHIFNRWLINHCIYLTLTNSLFHVHKIFMRYIKFNTKIKSKEMSKNSCIEFNIKEEEKRIFFFFIPHFSVMASLLFVIIIFFFSSFIVRWRHRGALPTSTYIVVALQYPRGE